MILPKGKIMYENLNTSFTNLEELLLDLKNNHVTGVVRLSFWNYEGHLFLDSGKIIQAFESHENEKKYGQEALLSLMTRSRDKDGAISVHRYTSELVMMLASSLNNEIVYKELSSDFTNLEKLLEKLKDAQLTGFLEIVTREGGHLASIFLQGGEPLESMVSLEQNVITVSGIHAQIFELALAPGIVYNVYKAALREAVHDLTTQADLSRLLDFWSHIMTLFAKNVTLEMFDRQLREILISKAEEFPFLDPFAGEFRYVDGKINFDGEFPDDFNPGMAAIIDELSQKIPLPNFRAEVASISQAFSEIVTRHHLAKILALPDVPEIETAAR